MTWHTDYTTPGWTEPTPLEHTDTHPVRGCCTVAFPCSRHAAERASVTADNPRETEVCTCSHYIAPLVTYADCPVHCG